MNNSSVDDTIKTCKRCHSEIDIGYVRCPFCNALQVIPAWVYIAAILVGIFLTSFTTAFFINKSHSNYGSYYPPRNQYNDSNNRGNYSSSDLKKKSYGFDEEFDFDELRISFGRNYTFSIVLNEYSDNYGKTAVRVPITVTNLASETHGLNMFFYDIYGTKGTRIDDLNIYFDDNIDYAGDLRSGASFTRYLYFIYDGDGEYAIEFDNFSQKVTVEFDIYMNNSY